MRKYLLVIGTSFPLKGGATKITEFYSRLFSKNNLKTIRFSYNDIFNFKNSNDLKPYVTINPFLKISSYLYILTRVFILRNKTKAAYIEENGGIFKIFDFLLMYLLTSLKIKCYYHNHSYQKINSPNFLTKMIVLLTSRGITNIFLNEIEATRFIKIYGPTKYYAVSNSIFINDDCSNFIEYSNEKLKFGLLSNFHKNKGLDEFIEIAKYAMKNKKPWEFYLAGPIIYNPFFYKEQICSLDNFKYLGPIYEKKQKNQFFKNLTFFVHLSTYKHESEPYVVLEAISKSCIPLVFDEGSSSELVPYKKLILDKTKDIPLRVDLLIQNLQLSKNIKVLKKNSYENFCKLRKDGEKNLNELIQEIKKI